MIGKFEELVLLALIKAGPASQAAKVYEVFQKTQSKMPKFAAMYTALDRMVTKRLVSEQLDESGSKPRRLFTITGAGRLALDEAVNATRNMQALGGDLGGVHV
ncbi:helix-turn-helix transcriptional regulator [Rhizobium sp. CIAT894]|uniref:PadR family transcriptional regulator n=1 Tax=Rhizobium sp. CIAT894 TaxID=2020312 RepID=UPI0013DE5040|nr:helix-turn-helix transcriptional regulator [Rhizobium sp. CIAT894]